jgi:hypothetical protein
MEIIERKRRGFSDVAIALSLPNTYTDIHRSICIETDAKIRLKLFQVCVLIKRSVKTEYRDCTNFQGRE